MHIAKSSATGSTQLALIVARRVSESAGSQCKRSRQDGTLIADMGALEHDEWELLLASVEAELARAAPVQVIIHAGSRPPDSDREALVETLSTIVRSQGVKVRVAYQNEGVESNGRRD
jgi:hypothetical protein